MYLIQTDSNGVHIGLPVSCTDDMSAADWAAFLGWDYWAEITEQEYMDYMNPPVQQYADARWQVEEQYSTLALNMREAWVSALHEDPQPTPDKFRMNVQYQEVISAMRIGYLAIDTDSKFSGNITDSNVRTATAICPHCGISMYVRTAFGILYYVCRKCLSQYDQSTFTLAPAIVETPDYKEGLFAIGIAALLDEWASARGYDSYERMAVQVGSSDLVMAADGAAAQNAYAEIWNYVTMENLRELVRNGTLTPDEAVDQIPYPTGGNIIPPPPALDGTDDDLDLLAVQVLASSSSGWAPPANGRMKFTSILNLLGLLSGSISVDNVQVWPDSGINLQLIPSTSLDVTTAQSISWKGMVSVFFYPYKTSV